MQCTQCNAQLQPEERRCAFCGAATPLALREAEEARRKTDDAEQARRAALEKAQRQAGLHSLLWSVVGLLCCFYLPVPGLIGAVLAFRARSVARQAGTVLPTSATVALVLSALSAVLFGVIVVALVVTSANVAKRAAALRAEVAAGAARPTLDQATACGLTELFVLDHGYQKANGLNIGQFECDGRLTQTGDRAVLDDVHFTYSSEQGRVTERACLVRGERWSVSSLGGCP